MRIAIRNWSDVRYRIRRRQAEERARMERVREREAKEEIGCAITELQTAKPDAQQRVPTAG